MTFAAHWGLVALAVTAGPLGAQQRTASWAAVGLGGGRLGGNGGLALSAAFSHQRGANLFTLRSAGVVDVLAGLFSGFTGHSEKTGASDVGLLYGRARRPGHAFFAVSAGIGVAQVTRDSAGTSRQTYHATVPLEAQVAWRPASFVGVFVLGFASLNKGQSFTGITAGMQLGGLY